MGCRLFCLCILGFLFRLLLLSFLSLLPPCRVLLRTSCCLVITVWLSPFSLSLSVLLKSPAASTALQPPLPPPVSLCRGSASLYFSSPPSPFFWGDPLSSSSVCWLALFFLFFLYFLSLFWLSDTSLPSARRAFSHGSVLRLFTVLWLVSGSQSCSCEAVSVSSMLWLVSRVDHVHKAAQLPGLTPTHPHIQNAKCHVGAMMLRNDSFLMVNFSVWGVSHYQPDETRSEAVAPTAKRD